MPDNKNFILAIALSIMVLVVWQYFFAAPKIEDALQPEPTQVEEPAAVPDATPATTADPSIPLPSAGTVETPAPAEAAEPTVASAARVPINTEVVGGSINTRGGRLDDLELKEYRETVEPDSPNIVLLSPSGGSRGYFAEFGWISGDANVPVPGPDTIWEAEPGATLTTDTPVTLTWDNGTGLTFTRTVAVDDEYMFTVADTVENDGAAAATLQPYGRVTRIGEPETQGFFILHEGPIGVLGADAEYRDYSYKKVTEEAISEPNVDSGWFGFTDKYWATALIPETGHGFDSRFVHFERDAPTWQADYRGDPISVAPGASVEYGARLFAGAKVVSIINSYAESLDIAKFHLLIDWGYFWMLTQPMFYALDWFFRLLGNFGVSILAVTVIVKLIFFPLANKSYKSMSAMKKLQPKMVEIRDRYKDDKPAQQKALMELYRTEKINPVAGCWPVLLQIPVFFALYKVLFITIEMRHAPFFGWIQDLAAPDPTTIFNLFGLIPWDVPQFLMFGVWPLVMGVTMWMQMRLNPTPPDPTQAMIFNWMPVIFTVMLARFPAGLVIYWTWNNTLSIIQQSVIMKRQGVKVELWDNIRSVFVRKPKGSSAQAGGDTNS